MSHFITDTKLTLNFWKPQAKKNGQKKNYAQRWTRPNSFYNDN